MTKLDPSKSEQLQSGRTLLTTRGLMAVGYGLALLIFAAGFFKASLEHGGPSSRDIGVMSASLVAALLIGYAIWRLLPRGPNEPVAPRVRSAQNILVATGVLSFLLGGLLAMFDGSVSEIFSNTPASPLFAIVSIALWLIVMPIVTYIWWKRVDEHEATAYRDGTFVGAHVYLFLAPAWWMATRAGWLPAQDPMIVLLLVSLVWTAVWLVKRYS